MKKVVAVLNRIVSIFLVALLLFAGYVFITVMRAGKDKVPTVFGYGFLQVATGSMEPTIPAGALIIVRETDASQVQVGDIITFYSLDPQIMNMPNTHRVTEIQKKYGDPVFITKGDATPTEDPFPVYPERLIGVYKRHFMVGNLTGILHSQYFFFFAMLVPLIIVIFVEVLRFKKSVEDKKEEKHEQDP